MNKGGKQDSGMKSLFTLLALIFCFGVGALLYIFVFGAAGNFTPEGKPANILGNIHEGGFIVPILLGINLIVLTFTVERMLTISKANGRGNIAGFVRNIRSMIAGGNIDEAIAECDRQRGSLANVVRAGLVKYKMVEGDASMDKETKLQAIQKDLEEATALELPMLSKNLVILSTLASVSTLVGLIGTVFGMIRAFQALAKAGAPDAGALSAGISEALWNTAFGIIGSAIAIIMYNVFSSRIDAITYGMDEANFSIVQTFAAKHNG
ncbi:MAG: biopolymer transport protein ExbB [Bacteroidetes bacterium]|nr:MAG: biopolymer transport protein ExbB [Bacteroidota bacterium]